MAIHSNTNSTKSLTKRVLAAAFLTAAALSSGVAVVDPAIASAFPSESVRNAFAACVNKVPVDDPNWEGNVVKCCLENGGFYTDGSEARGCTLPEEDAPKNEAVSHAGSQNVQEFGPTEPPQPAKPTQVATTGQNTRNVR
jgi:hypothetical protein